MEVRFVVGKNGSGKSRYLQIRAEDSKRPTLIICNTVHDRYRANKRVKKFSIRSANNKPESIIKSSFLMLAKEGPHRLNSIAKILEYCNYEPKLLFVINPHDELINNLKDQNGIYNSPEWRDINLLLLTAIDRNETHLEIDMRELSFSSLSQQKILLWLDTEKKLKRQKMLSGIDIYITPKHQRNPIKLVDASSGELTLIASQIFILSNITENSLLLIDEPENSLHPQWQKDYVTKLADLISYYDSEIVIATHSPIIVSGAQAIGNVESDFYHAETGQIAGSEHQTQGIEESLWEQFETISPESRYVSEHIVSLLEKLENKDLSLFSVTQSLNQMKKASYDERQEKVLRAAVKLAEEISQEIGND